MHEYGLSKLAIVEFIGSVLWFSMDACWMLNWHPAYLAGPAILVHLWALWLARQELSEFLVWLATMAWLCMNVFWMISEVYRLPEALTAAKGFFAVGGITITSAVLVRREVIARFRRLRIR